jgi:hypothetical protein
MAAKTSEKTTTETQPVEKPKRDRSKRQVVKIHATERGVGRVYAESSGKYVVQTRKTKGGYRSRRRFDKLADAKAAFKLAVAEFRTEG